MSSYVGCWANSWPIDLVAENASEVTIWGWNGGICFTASSLVSFYTDSTCSKSVESTESVCNLHISWEGSMASDAFGYFEAFGIYKKGHNKQEHIPEIWWRWAQTEGCPPWYALSLTHHGWLLPCCDDALQGPSDHSTKMKKNYKPSKNMAFLIICNYKWCKLG